MSKFSGLSVLATVLTVVGWIAVPVGLFVAFVATQVDDGTFAQSVAGATLAGAGITLVLVSGGLKVLIAIESNTRRD